MSIRINTDKVLSRIQWSSIAISVTVTIVVVMASHREHHAVLQQIRENAHCRMERAKEHVEEYMLNVGTILRFVSLDDEVQCMTKDSKDYVETIYEDSYERHLLSEIYVIERDFDGTRRPFMTFEREGEEHDEEVTHDLASEKFEYETQLEHIREFARNPELEMLTSSPGKLCVRNTGIVCSVPIRDEGEFVGIVAGMIPQENISKVLRISDCHEMMVLVNERGDIFTCEDLDEQIRTVLEARLRTCSIEGLLDREAELTEVGQYSLAFTEPNVHDRQRWCLIYICTMNSFILRPMVSRAL